MSSIGYRRSDITTDSSMKLYASFYDQASEIGPVRLFLFTNMRASISLD